MSNIIERIGCTAAAAPGGHYSPATAWGDLLFVSGQLPVKVDGGHAADQPFEAQARQALDNLLAILAEGGSGPAQVLRVNAYIVDVANWSAFNTIYAELFADAKPARVVVPVPQLHHGYLVEVDAIAIRRA